MGNNWFNQKQHKVLIGILFFVSYLLLMFGNSIVSLTHPDEVFYIESAKDMLKHRSWLTPMIFDEVQFEKPFFAFALFAAAIKWFGLTPFAGRFFPSLFGMAGVGVVYWIAWMLFKNKRTSFFSGFILSSSFIYVALSRAVLTDVIFSVLITASIGFFYFAYSNRKFKNSGIILWGIFSALAVLTKGLLGIIFPLAIVLIFLTYKRELIFLKCRTLLFGCIIFLAIAVPWHVLMYLEHGKWFLEEYFYNVHWRRVLESEHARLDNWYFYIMLMVVGVMPWFIFWIPAVRSMFNQFQKKLASRDKLFFLISWIIGVYIFVQPAHSKLASYIFPLFPAIVIILAFTINEFLNKAENGESTKMVKYCSFFMSLFWLTVAIVGPIVAKQYPEILVDLNPIYFASLMLLVISITIFIFTQKKMYTQMVLTYVGVTITLISSLYLIRPSIEPWVSCKNIVDIFKTRDQSQAPILTSKFYVRGVRYYTDRPVAIIDWRGRPFWSKHPVPFLDEDKKVVDFLSKRKITWGILKEGNVKDLKRILRENPNKNFKLNEFEHVGGKFIVNIEQIKVQ